MVKKSSPKSAPKTPINVLILGSGGREHALGWKLKQSKGVAKLFFAPGNGGTSELGENVDLKLDPVSTKTCDAIDYFARHNKVGMIVIGPEDPLAGGMADRLMAMGHRVFGPVKEAARIEGDKAFSKQLMRAVSIPTAEARTFTDLDRALVYVESRDEDEEMVVKAAGLAKGKGVVVCDNRGEAIDAVNMMMGDRVFGEAGDTIVIEERLMGQEISVLALVDGRTIFVLDPAQDHKQAYEGDTGPNTGGMGAYSPTPLLDEKTMTAIEAEIIVPIIDALRRDGVEFKGVLFAGLMLTPAGPKVIEFNVRFGDPECQTLLVRMTGDLFKIMNQVIDGELEEAALSFDKSCCCCVVMASGGYPGKYENGKAITGIADAESDPDVRVFHAGTKLTNEGVLVTNGGRVLNVCAVAPTLAEAQIKANAACDKIKFEGAQFRRDIGYRVM